MSFTNRQKNFSKSTFAFFGVMNAIRGGRGTNARTRRRARRLGRQLG